MSTSKTLNLRRAERDQLLVRVVLLLEQDERIAAAWLSGSLGRGTEDAWSDLDLWVVVADEHLDAVLDARRESVSLPARPLVILDVPGNGPKGGGFFSVVYEGQVCGPQNVDWTWQPQSSASIPGDARVLFDRVGLPHAVRPQAQSPEERLERARQQVAFFWMMVPVVGKYIARRQSWSAVNLLTILVDTIEQIDWLLGNTSQRPVQPTKRSDPPPTLTEDQLALLRKMASGVEKLVARSDVLTGSVQPETPHQVYDFLDLVSRI